MGIYDRDYQRSSYGDEPGVHLRGPQSMVMKLVIINAIVYVVQLMFQNADGSNAFDSMFALREDWFREPWRFFELLTYGFLHSPESMWHILMNMFLLWMFGSRIEERYGGKEFLAFYLTAIVFAAICWNISELFAPGMHSMLGASGGVAAVLLLFIFCFPRVTLMFMLVIPMPAWVVGVFLIASDVFGAVTRHGNTAFMAHLGGFLFGYLYYKFGWRLADWVPTSWSLPKFKRKPPLRLHRPPADEEDKNEKRVNELLDKINAHGQDSLTSGERRELTKLSKHFQNKRK